MSTTKEPETQWNQALQEFRYLHLAMTECEPELPLDFYQLRPLQVQFSERELSSDAGLL